ncbi:long-chain fatty acid-CoA ligase [Umbelopsis nana]
MPKAHSQPVIVAPQGESHIRRSTLATDEIISKPAADVHTLYDVLQNSVKKFGDKEALGFRNVVDIIEEEKEVVKIVNGEERKEMKKWKYFQLSEFQYVGYRKMSEIAHDIGAGLAHLGLKKGSKLEIFAATSADWLFVAHSAFTQNISIVTAYDTLGESGLLHSMNETEVEAIFTNGDLLPTLLKVLPDCPSLKHVIYCGEAKPDIVEKVKAQVGSVISLKELKALGRQHPTPPVKPKAEDICCIMYTSGSTGNPKGVILKHANLVAAIGGVDKLLGKWIGSNDSIMAYLPLAHVLEFLVENLCLYWGVTLGYGTVRTLTDASVRNCKGDIKEFRPTILTGVPTVWESIRKGILAGVNSSPTVKKVFERAFTAKAWLMERGLPTPVLDKLVFSKIKAQVGGRLRFGLSGGAPISLETQKFLSVCLAPILGGYGMTESVGMCCIMTPENFHYGRVGAPVPCCEIKLVDVPDTNYKSTNKPKPQGEVWVRGPSITAGYWKRDDVTAETIMSDGWLRTGDVGELNKDGTLSIIDRAKNLVKLSNGEYIALEKLESIYKSCLVVNNLCVYGDSLRPKPVAIIVPLEPRIKELAKEMEIEGDFEALCANQVIRQEVLRLLLDQAKVGGLKGSELLHDVHLTHEEWTPENGFLTAAQKLKRNDINKHYKKELDTMNAAQKL